jgi:hypothetical protein
MTAETSSLTVQCKVHFQQMRHGRRQMAVGPAPAPMSVPLGRVPRLSRLMALAIRFEGLLHAGEVADYAELARLAEFSNPLREVRRHRSYYARFFDGSRIRGPGRTAEEGVTYSRDRSANPGGASKACCSFEDRAPLEVSVHVEEHGVGLSFARGELRQDI